MCDCNIWRHVGRFDDLGVEVDGDGDAAHLLLQGVSLITFLHIEDGRLVRMKTIVLVYSRSMLWEANASHEQAVELVALEQWDSWRLLSRKREIAQEGWVGSGGVRCRLDDADAKLVYGDSGDFASDIEPKVEWLMSRLENIAGDSRARFDRGSDFFAQVRVGGDGTWGDGISASFWGHGSPVPSYSDRDRSSIAVLCPVP